MHPWEMEELLLHTGPGGVAYNFSAIPMLREHITQSGNSLRAAHTDLANDLLKQHRAIVRAILAGDGEKARKAMHAHIDFVSARVG